MKKKATLRNACVLLLFVAPAAFAQSASSVVSGVNSVLKLVVSIVGPSVLGYGLIRAFVAHSAGDQDGMMAARNAVVGGLGILFTFTLVKLIVSASGVSY